MKMQYKEFLSYLAKANVNLREEGLFNLLTIPSDYTPWMVGFCSLSTIVIHKIYRQ